MKVFNKILLSILAIVISLGAGASIVVYKYYQSLSLSELNKELDESTLIFDSEDVLLDEVHGEEHRKIVPLENIDKDLVNAVIAIEDANFYKHNGVSVKSVGRAVVKNIRTKSRSEGASTITMQLTKNLIGSVEERSWNNKIRETFLALKLERNLSKDEILELYLNTIYWGNNTYGIETATETYFGKDASDIEIHEAAVLAAMIQNPSRFNIYQESRDEAYAALKGRQMDVLDNMAYSYSDCIKGEYESLYIQCLNNWSLNQYSEPLLFSGKTTWQVSKEGYTTDLAIAEAIEILKLDSVKDLGKGGYRIYSTINKKHQELAKTTINNYKGYKGGAQFGLASIDPTTNKVLVSVGGTDYNTSPLNRTVDNGGLRGRQPGSSIKLYVYYQAMRWLDPEDIIIDDEYCIYMRWEKDYCPRNYDGSFKGDITLSTALALSRNIPAVKLGQWVGIRNVINTMKDLGINTKLDVVPSFPLGSNDLVVMEHVNAVAAFANNGKQQDYTSIERIEDSEGRILYQYSNNQTQKLDRNAVNKLNVMTRKVVENGTGKSAEIPGLNIMGKTGTTSDTADVWFIGYNKDIVTAVWIGHDDFNKKLYSGATGGGWAAPVFKSFVSEYYNRGYNK